MRAGEVSLQPTTRQAKQSAGFLMSARPADQQLTTAARGRDTRRRPTVSLAERLEAADKIDARLPHPTVADHLEDDLKARLIELAKNVI